MLLSILLGRHLISSLALYFLISDSFSLLIPALYQFLILVQQAFIFLQHLFDSDKIFINIEQVLHLFDDNVFDSCDTSLVFLVIVLERGDLLSIFSRDDCILKSQKFELADLVNVQRKDFCRDRLK